MATLLESVETELSRLQGIDLQHMRLGLDHGALVMEGEIDDVAAKRHCLEAAAAVGPMPTSAIMGPLRGLGVEPPQEDSDDEIEDAVAIALEKDPFVGAGRVSVSAQRGVIVLDGAVRSADERRMAEHDAWFVFGVNGVDHRLSISP